MGAECRLPQNPLRPGYPWGPKRRAGPPELQADRTASLRGSESGEGAAAPTMGMSLPSKSTGNSSSQGTRSGVLAAPESEAKRRVSFQHGEQGTMCGSPQGGQALWENRV